MLQLILNFMERVLLWLLGLVGSRAVCAKATQLAVSNCKKARAAARTVHRSGPSLISEEREFLHLVSLRCQFGSCHVGARLKCHRVCKVEMTLGRRGGLTRPHVSPEFCAMDGPLSAYLAPPDCLAAAGVVDRPADGSADMKLAARARMPAPR